MSLEYSYKDVEWCSLSHYKSDECFCEGNIIIPDSMDDIAKIVTVKAHPCITDVKCENGRIVINGQVKLTVLYLCENENDRIATLSATQPFSHTITADNISEDNIALVNITSCSVNHSTVNSRRLKTTALLRFSAQCYKNSRLKILSDVSGAEVKSKEYSFSSARVICRKTAVVNSTAEIPTGKDAIVSILKQDVRISDKDFKVLSNKLIIKGNIAISILYCSHNGITDASVSIPFTEVVEAEGLSPSCQTQVSAHVSDWDITPDTDLSGEYRMLDANIILSVTIKAFTPHSVLAINDIYLPGGALSTKQTNIILQDSADEVTGEEFVKEIINLPKGAPSVYKVLDAECHVSDITCSENTATANADVCVMYLSSDSPTSVNTVSARIPIAHKLSSQNLCDTKCSLGHISYSIASPDSLELRLNAIFASTPTEESTATVLTECVEESYAPEKRASIIV
ncbi:MAG: DUF3794 domain-containing protein, partial [Clostridia bacterium]|nr:DUF3794 domain-containing protein [Clostridia bacterium]